MNARISFLKRLAFGVAVSLSASAAFAQTTNWTATTAPPKNWNDAANWSSGVPATGGVATLNSGTKLIVVNGDTNDLQTLQFGSSGWTVGATGSTGAVVLRATSGGGTITNNGSNNVISSLKLLGDAKLDGGGSLTLGTITGAGSSILNINKGTVTVTSNATGLGTVNIGLASDPVTATLANGASFGGAAVNVGSVSTLQASGSAYNGILGALSLNSNSTLGARVGTTTDKFTASSVTLDPTSGLYLDFATLNAGSLVKGNTFQIVNGATTGSFGNISDSTYGYWTKTGNDFVSGQIAGAASGLYFQYNNSNGTLVVVPEPSTLVFAGVGVAMAGWSAWKKRRLAKVLAKN